MELDGFIFISALFMLLGTIFAACAVHGILAGLETSRSLVGALIWGCVLLPLAFFLYVVAGLML